jgi:hypothetical protein
LAATYKSNGTFNATNTIASLRPTGKAVKREI